MHGDSKSFKMLQLLHLNYFASYPRPAKPYECWVVKLSTNVCKLVDVKLGHRCKDHNRRAVWLAEILKATHHLCVSIPISHILSNGF